ncbi:uncharacterized protein LOC114580708 [Dendrobium catenatum]|uniref:uncharacterized protein LOC114580708 n=1 Tax=Dendrobium catenatum TaxID=906689 RepID=UPI0010A091F6|nr:uncharacterized protein LOC114580708 [Dendrobium catenatum]
MGSAFVDDTVMKINLIKERLKSAQNRQQKYYNQKHRLVEFQIGDFVYVKISPMKGVSIFGRVSKLNPRLLLPDQMSDIHNVFHVSSLRKWISDSGKKLSTDDIKV